MCGFLGVWNTNISYFDDRTSKQIFSKLNKRGPDSKGYINYKKNPSFHLWHARLSIQDLSNRSNQPYQDQNSALVYNGEIYNHNKFNKFKGPKEIFSDTDFVWNAFKNKGFYEQIESIEGMWAIAFIEKDNNKLHLSRDRFGQKPLFYSFLKKNKGIVFSSSINALLRLIDFPIELNYPKLEHYLKLGFRSSSLNKSETYVKDIFSIEPGTSLIFDEYMNQKKIIHFNNTRKIDAQISYEDYKESLLKVIKSSIEEVVISDRPLSILLSGGIDSSFIYQLIQKMDLGDSLSAYSHIHDVDGYDESRNIELNTKNNNGRHYYVNSKSMDFQSLWWELTAENLYPLPNQSSFSFAALVKKIRANQETVILSGVGADELFGGYYTHLIAYLSDLYESDPENPSLKQWENSEVYKKIRMNLLKDVRLFSEHTKSNSFGFHEYNQNKKIFNCSLDLANINLVERQGTNLDDLLFYDLTCLTLPPALYVNDTIGMHYSCEARAPFLFNKIVNLALKIPGNFLFENLTTKSILRDASRNIIPDKIAKDKNKIGFYGDINELVSPIKNNLIELVKKSNFLSDQINLKTFDEYMKLEKLNNVQSKCLFSIYQTAILESIFNEI